MDSHLLLPSTSTSTASLSTSTRGGVRRENHQGHEGQDGFGYRRTNQPGRTSGRFLASVSQELPAEPATAFHPPVRLKADGKIIDSGPDWRHCGPCIDDLDGDGLDDLIVGDFGGKFRYYRNVGTAEAPKYAAGDLIQAGNVGKPHSPAFSAPQELVPPHDGNGYYLVRWSDQKVVPGIRSQIEVTDYDRDGKLDLLVGDFYSAYHFRADLSADQKAEVQHLVDENKELRRKLTAKLDALQAEFNERYPGDTIFTQKADEEWAKKYQAFLEGPEAQQLNAAEAEFVAKMRPFLAGTDGTGDRYFYLAKPHGHVWLYHRR